MDVTKAKRILVKHELTTSAADEDIRRVLLSASYTDEEVDTVLVLFAMPTKAAVASGNVPTPEHSVRASKTPFVNAATSTSSNATAAQSKSPKKRSGFFTRKRKDSNPAVTLPTVVKPVLPPASTRAGGVPLRNATTRGIKPTPPRPISQMPMSGATKKIFHGSGVLDTAEIRQLLGVDVTINTDFSVSERVHGYFSTFQFVLVWFFAALIAVSGVLYFMYIEEMGIFHETSGGTPFDHYLPDR